MRLALSLLLLAAGFWAVVEWRAARREAAAERHYPPEGRILEVDGIPIHAVVMGSGPDLVLIHGASGNTRDLTFAFAGLMADRYRVIVFDRPGMGYTGRTDPAHGRAFTSRAESPAEQADLLVAAARALGADRPIVLGHSYGNTVALAWALRHPDRIAAIVNVAGVALPWPGSLGLQYRVNGSAIGGAILPPVITAFVPESVIERAFASVFAPDPVPPGYAAHFGEGLTLRRASLRANARQVNGLRPHVVEMSADYGQLSLPIEIVHGDADTTVPLSIHAEPFAARVPSARLTILPGIGHMPHHAAPEAVAAAVDRAAARAGLR